MQPEPTLSGGRVMKSARHGNGRWVTLREANLRLRKQLGDLQLCA